MNEPLDLLIQRVLEGDASEAERTGLESRAAREPAVRARLEAQRAAFHALSTAQPADAPAGLRDDILHAIRGAAPVRAQAAARAGRPRFSWLRLALPAAAVAVAAIVMMTQDRDSAGDLSGRISGSMSGVHANAPVLDLGSGAEAVTVRAEGAGGAFRIVARSGAAPVKVHLGSATPGLVFATGQGDAPAFEADLPAHSVMVSKGTGAGPRASLVVSITYADGRSARGELRLRGIRPPR